MDTKSLVVFGYGQRGAIYAAYAKKYPEKFNLVAVIETDDERMALANNGDDVLFESINALKSSMEKKNAEGATTFDQLAELIKKMRSDSSGS